MRWILIICCIVWAGCSTGQPPEVSYILPQLIERTPLPALPINVGSQRIELAVKLKILENGTVGRASLLTSSGSADWDSLATNALKSWRFSPARFNGKPIALWVSQRIIVVPTDPEYIDIAAILCRSREQADSIHQALIEGEDWEKCSQRFSATPLFQNERSRRVEINCYGDVIRKSLRRLSIGEFSEPLSFGDTFVIFKRVNN
jgi:TonB family protein